MRLALVLVAVQALAGLSSPARQSIQRVNPPGMTQPGGYHHVVRAGDLLFIAGQVALDAAGRVVGEGDMPTQVKQVFENLRRVLASQEVDFSHVVKITIYTTDMQAFRAASEVRRSYLGDHPPASTLVEVRKLARPELLVEIEAIAVADGGS